MNSFITVMLLTLTMLIVPVVSPGKDIADPLLSANGQAEIPSFGEVVRRNWSSWSQGNETVSKQNLIARIASPEYRGEDAAALVALENYMKKTQTVDLPTAAAIDNDKILDIYYKNVLKLRNVKRTLFANGAPTFELLQQGPSGDCYFFSASGWMAKNRPHEVMNAVTTLEGGGYRVRFANGDEASVAPPTDAELAINASLSTLRDGLWMPVFEKAVGVIQARTIRKAADVPDPTVAIDISGVPISSVIRRWTGHEVKVFRLGSRADRQLVRSALVRMHDLNSLATALLLRQPPAKLPFDHVYAIMDFQPDTDTLAIWNPWGTDFTPKGPSGPENGYERKKGIFFLSLDDFINFYTYLAIERN